MCEKYTSLVAALKALTQGDKPEEVVTLPMAEDEYNTRPDTVSYGIVSLDFESDAMDAEDEKQDRSFEGSVHLFSLERSRMDPADRKDAERLLRAVLETEQPAV